MRSRITITPSVFGKNRRGSNRHARLILLLTIQRRWNRCCLKQCSLTQLLGAVYLQLGILYSQNADYPRAIAAYQKAIEVSSNSDDTLEQAHYRLAQAYLRTGDKIEAQAELQLHDDLSRKTKDDSERSRREIKEFVISLQNKPSASTPQP